MKKYHVINQQGRVLESYSDFTTAHAAATLRTEHIHKAIIYTTAGPVPLTIERKNWIHAPREYELYSVTTSQKAHRYNVEDIRDGNRRERIHAGPAWRTIYKILTIKKTDETGRPIYCLYIH